MDVETAVEEAAEEEEGAPLDDTPAAETPEHAPAITAIKAERVEQALRDLKFKQFAVGTSSKKDDDDVNDGGDDDDEDDHAQDVDMGHQNRDPSKTRAFKKCLENDPHLREVMAGLGMKKQGESRMINDIMRKDSGEV
eukprot:8868591-Karenia_brevis.AAC.1